MKKLFWVDTKWACGGVETENNIVVKTAPIFKKFIGQHIVSLTKFYKVREVKQ